MEQSHVFIWHLQIRYPSMLTVAADARAKASKAAHLYHGAADHKRAQVNLIPCGMQGEPGSCNSWILCWLSSAY